MQPFCKNLDEGSLLRLIESQGTLSESICLGLQELHDNCNMHNDLRPENILMDENLQVKICNFQCSVLNANNIINHRIIEYMAPEVLQKQTQSYSADIWSLGILLFEMIHGETPYFYDQTAENMHDAQTKYFNMIQSQQLQFIEQTTNDYQDLVKSLLQVNPNQRTSLTNLFAHPWLDYKICEEMNQQQTFDLLLLHMPQLSIQPQSKKVSSNKSTDESIQSQLQRLQSVRSQQPSSTINSKSIERKRPEMLNSYSSYLSYLSHDEVQFVRQTTQESCVIGMNCSQQIELLGSEQSETLLYLPNYILPAQLCKFDSKNRFKPRQYQHTLTSYLEYVRSTDCIVNSLFVQQFVQKLGQFLEHSCLLLAVNFDPNFDEILFDHEEEIYFNFSCRTQRHYLYNLGSALFKLCTGGKYEYENEDNKAMLFKIIIQNYGVELFCLIQKLLLTQPKQGKQILTSITEYKDYLQVAKVKNHFGQFSILACLRAFDETMSLSHNQMSQAFQGTQRDSVGTSAGQNLRFVQQQLEYFGFLVKGEQYESYEVEQLMNECRQATFSTQTTLNRLLSNERKIITWWPQTARQSCQQRLSAKESESLNQKNQSEETKPQDYTQSDNLNTQPIKAQQESTQSIDWNFDELNQVQRQDHNCNASWIEEVSWRTLCNENRESAFIESKQKHRLKEEFSKIYKHIQAILKHQPFEAYLSQSENLLKNLMKKQTIPKLKPGTFEQ